MCTSRPSTWQACRTGEPRHNRATNRIITGGHSYDANGKLTAIPLLQMSYDALNRMTQATHDSNGTDQYAYDPWNRMVWNKIQSSTEYVTFYGAFGEVLGRFRVSPEAGGQFAHERRRIYFGGRQILTDDQTRASVNVTDRLGSVRNSVYGAESYYPFGEIKTGNGDTFATYPRNATSNLHYATNRWYSNQIARFTTPDPWGPSATPGDPQSWNRYAYVQNDPVNYTDRTGLLRDICLEPEMQGNSYCAYKKGGSFDLQPVWALFPRLDGEGLGHRLILGFAPVGVPGAALGGSTRADLISPPKLPKGTKANYQRVFDAGWSNAYSRLLDQDCLNFFGAGAVAEFRNTRFSFQPLGAPVVDQTGRVNVVGAATHRGENGSPSTVFINSQGPFLSQVIFVPGKGMTTLDLGTGLRGANFGALVLLHELGHVTGKFGPDANDLDLNRSFTQDVLKECFK